MYANRSACLYHLEDYDRAISDIRRALDNGYPKDLRYKVYDRLYIILQPAKIGRISYISQWIHLMCVFFVCRRARCLLATKQLKCALESFKMTMEALDESGLPLDERRKRQLDVQVLLTMMANDNNLKNGM